MLRKQSFSVKVSFLLGITLFAVLGIATLPAIAQEQIYHHFADQRTVLGIPNFWNVASNIPFLIVGAMGINGVIRKNRLTLLPEILPVYLAFFLGIFLIGIGSGYYHLWPSNETLVFDRLAMAVAFMAFFTIIISEFISDKAGKRLFLPLLLFGLFSVGYWYVTESKGEGDLRLYVLVQFLPMLLIPLILLLFSPRFSHIALIWAALVAYLMSKIAEMTDVILYLSLAGVSGHSLKHLFSALSAYLFFLALKKRVPIKNI